MQKVSGYLPKSGRYTEIFRIINSSTRTGYKCYPLGTLHPPSSVEHFVGTDTLQIVVRLTALPTKVGVA